jgi:hypothetical protein
VPIYIEHARARTHTHSLIHTHTHTQHTHTHMQREREPRCTRACAWRMCMGHMHVHADGHSGHVLVECVRADCLLVSCPGASTCSATQSACCRRASLTSSRRSGKGLSEGGRVYGALGGGGQCVGACVAWCDRAHVHAACMSVRVYIDMGIPMHTLYLS